MLVITQRCLKFFLFFLFVALFVGVVSAKVYPPSNSHLHLGYCNGTYTDAPSGYLYYDSLQRINNVWYINGQAVSTPSTESFDTTIFIALLVLSIIIFGLAVWRQKIVLSLLSMLLWIVLSITIFYFTDGLVYGAALLFMLLGVIMLIDSVYLGLKILQEASEEKQRRIAEEIF